MAARVVCFRGGSALALVDLKEWLVVNTTFATEESASSFSPSDIYLVNSPSLTCQAWQGVKDEAMRPCPAGQGARRPSRKCDLESNLNRAR